MSLSRWSPMGELAGLHSAMDRVFGDFFGTSLTEDGGLGTRTWYLPLDIVDAGDAYQVKAAIPGFKPEDVEVTYSEGVLSIMAEHKEESESKRGSYLRRELTYGNYARSVQLPGGINESEIKAEFGNGMLTVEIPKMAAPKPVKIPISGGAHSEKKLVGAKSEK
ncbi:MAG TPA: Hsp20/alpha crystallin family protein [Candidatus Dormibacteraeota bacterium]|nr:Hsp20/alpha crystallin family protein [Candidatus Dormibacteraeota bacterium]